MKLRDQSIDLHSPFFAILHYKSTEFKKLQFLGDFFSLHVQNLKDPNKEFLFGVGGSVYEVSYHVPSCPSLLLLRTGYHSDALT